MSDLNRSRHGHAPVQPGNRNENFVVSPNDPPARFPRDYRGGPGEYDGEGGYPERTSSPNAAPEKIIDGNLRGQRGMPGEGAGSEGNEIE